MFRAENADGGDTARRYRVAAYEHLEITASGIDEIGGGEGVLDRTAAAGGDRIVGLDRAALHHVGDQGTRLAEHTQLRTLDGTFQEVDPVPTDAVQDIGYRQGQKPGAGIVRFREPNAAIATGDTGHIEAGTVPPDRDIQPAHPAVACGVQRQHLEIGRTVRVNGSNGTDHGTATVAFLVGRAVAGGRVVANWPGLAAGQLFENRDLQPTLDIRAVAKGVIGPHFGLSAAGLATVFPDSDRVMPKSGLIKV
jgi:hypothetical protein